MKLQTKYFGEIDYDPSDSVRFPAGLFGFEDEQSFLILPFEGSANEMLCLQSTATPSLAFVMLDPFCLDNTYEPVLSKKELKMFGAESIESLCFYVLCAVKNPVSDSTVNLKCPVVVDPVKLEAQQVIMETEKYTMRHSLGDLRRAKEGEQC